MRNLLGRLNGRSPEELSRAGEHEDSGVMNSGER